MPNIRLIARLDIKGNYLIKSINLEGLRKIGDPSKYALRYYNDHIDGFESSRDRHENLGKGNIPKAELEYVIKNCKSDIVVETPGGLEAQKKDIAWIKRRLKK